MEYRIGLIHGDGIGPEIVKEAKKSSGRCLREIWT